jgi:glycosyltransferase involved in cell wall biosynthesis
MRFAGASASVYDELSAQGKFGGQWCTLHDGVELSKFSFVSKVSPDAPLVFLGRIERIKGVHTAIAIAKKTGDKLLIAGNRSETHDKYFEKEIAPQIDNQQISYMGPVDDVQKNLLLGSAKALLFPIEWKEAFGIVLAESFACGTPVIAYPCGSVPEVVKPGVNGFICANFDEAVKAVGRIQEIDRGRVREDCETRFSDRVIVDRLETILMEAIRDNQK